jgi:protein involved in polysaccharide export with SLBB domain
MTDCNLHRAGRCWMRNFAVLTGLMLLAIVSGCAGARVNAPRSEFVPFTPEQKATLDAQANHSYRIQEGDILKVYFAFQRELNQDGVVVLADGSISLIGVDRIPISGLTLSEVDSVLTAAYSRDYREPALSVMIQETQGRRVYVTGQVRNPGYYPVPVGGMDVMGAITIAGGLVEDAAEENTVIVRVMPEGYQCQQVDLSHFGSSKYAPFAVMPLRAYDVVYVPRSGAGDFQYLTKSILVGLGYITRMAYDIYNVANGVTGRY